MKVLHLITVNAIGGAEKLMPLFLPAQRQAGLEVDCLLLYHKDYSTAPVNETARQLNEHGIKYFIVRCESINDKGVRNKIADIINENGYDLAHSHLKYADFFLSQLKSKRRINIPVVSTLHGYRDSYQNRFGLKVKWQLFFSIYYWITRFIFNQLNGYVFISNCMKSFYTRAGLLRDRPNTIIYHGYPAGETMSTGDDVFLHGNSSPAIGLPGRLIKMKGHRFAINAVAMLVKTYPGISLHIYGSGPEEEAIRHHIRQARLEEKITLYGYVDDLSVRLKKMDIILVPSSGEAFGIVFLEAFAAGVPVVAFDLPAGNEIITDGYNGMLAEPHNTTSLASKINELCANREKYQQIRSHAFENLKERFSLNRMVLQYKDFYELVLENVKQGNNLKPQLIKN